MNLHQYSKEITKLALEHGDLEVWYSSDNEGNSFSPVFYPPSIVKTNTLNNPMSKLPKEKTVVVVN